MATWLLWRRSFGSSDRFGDGEGSAEGAEDLEVVVVVVVDGVAAVVEVVLPLPPLDDS